MSKTPEHEVSSINSNKYYPLINGARRVAIGLGGAVAAVAAGYIGYEAFQDASEIASAQFVMESDKPLPSTDASDMYNMMIDGLAVAGAVGVGVVGAKSIRRAISPKYDAIYHFAHQDQSKKNLKKYGISLLAMSSVTLFGMSTDIARGVAESQTDAAAVMRESFEETKPGQKVFFLSASPTPELASSPSVPNVIIKKLTDAESKRSKDVTYVPINYSWQTAKRDDMGDNSKMTVLTLGMPREAADVDNANGRCTDIPVAMAKEGGVKNGEVFEMEGAEYKVVRSLKGSGVNLVPIVMTDDSYKRCMAGNADMPYSGVLLHGTEQDVNDYLKTAGVKLGGDGADRIHMVTLDEFFKNTRQTSEGNVNGLVLTALAGMGALTLVAFYAQSRTEFANYRETNALLKANGVSNNSIAAIAHDRADRTAMVSSVASLPLIYLIDGYNNSTLPGANLGPNAMTALSVMGMMWTVGNVAVSISARKDLRNMNVAKKGAES